jgi:uncharacterized protein (TIGR03084 family)
VDEVLVALGEQQAELSGFLDGLAVDDWARPSQLDGWSCADVVLHLAQTNEMALASLEGRFPGYLDEVASRLDPMASVDDGAGLMVELERDQPASAIHERWRTGVETMADAFRAADPHERVQWVAGTLSAHTLGSTRLAETWIHTGDITGAFGNEPVASARLRFIARLAWRTLPYAFAREGRELHGPVTFELLGPDGVVWVFRPDDPAATTIRGDALELCLVAGRRIEPRQTGLVGEGPDAEAVLDLVRTYA